MLALVELDGQAARVAGRDLVALLRSVPGLDDELVRVRAVLAAPGRRLRPPAMSPG